MKQTIFIVEDEPALQELYAYSLENEFDCRCFDNGEPFFDALTTALPDLVLLDIMLPGDDGFAILSRIKSDSKFSHIPVIIISAKDEEISKVKGLNMGADDYIPKPFGVLELVARAKANLRKNSKSTAESIIYKDIFIDSAKHQITVNGNQIQVTLKEYNLMCLLCENAGKVQERKVIFNHIWGDSFIGETRTLDIHIKEIRKKLSEAESTASIQTVRGVGYMLT
jgi:two-component system alkaline phosphatase synthesis response regulator PhoP